MTRRGAARRGIIRDSRDHCVKTTLVIYVIEIYIFLRHISEPKIRTQYCLLVILRLERIKIDF